MSDDKNAELRTEPGPDEPEPAILTSASARKIIAGDQPISDSADSHFTYHWSRSVRRMVRSERWRESSEGKLAVKNLTKWCSIALGVMVLIFIGGLAAVIFGAGWRISLLIFLGGGLICAGILAIAYWVYRTAKETSEVFTRASADGDRAEADDATGEPGTKWLKDIDLQNLLIINREQMKVYHEIATQQAKVAFRSCQMAICLGFLVLIAGSVVAIRTDNDTAKIVVGALTAVGAAMSTYIGRTFFRAQREAMEQLNFYFRQPLVTSYVLAAERLTAELNDSDGRKQELVTDVVRRVLLAARNAYEGGKSRGSWRGDEGVDSPDGSKAGAS